MAWSYRRSIRFPLGFRLNVSKSGFGYSWGFRGFRTGRDAKHNRYEQVSIPGTGLYNRQRLRPGVVATHTGWWALVLCGLWALLKAIL